MTDMLPAVVLDSYRRMMDDVGEIIIIRQVVGTGLGRTTVDTSVRARVTGYEPNELVGTIQQGDRRIIVLEEDWAAAGFTVPISLEQKVIVRGDELKILGLDDSTRRLGVMLAAYDLHCRG